MEMTTTGMKKRSVFLYMSFLSLVSPLGVLVGIGVTVHMEQAGGVHLLIIGILQGVAAGTLLYITFYEVLSRDKLAKYGMSGLFGAIAVLLGFLLMAGMEAGSGGHSHGGGGHGHGHVGHYHQGELEKLVQNWHQHSHEHEHNF